MALAIPEALLHSYAFIAFSKGLREEHGDLMKEWEEQVRVWEEDHTKPNPTCSQKTVCFVDA